MSFSGWDEDIMTSRGGGPAIIPMKFKVSAQTPERSVKDLPLKLQFSCPDAKALQSKIVAAGGTAVTTPTAAAAGQKEGTLYAKDIDGYLLELVPGGTGVGLTAVGYGSSNMTQSAAFFSRLAGTTPGQVVKTEAWDIITVPTKKKMSVQFLDFHDQRNTKKLPLKIVWGVSNISGFKSTIKDNGGSMVQQSLGALGAFVGLGYDAVDQIMIEINQGG
jgi:predicted enzyme related to lactoylglutathione lyase